MDAAAQQVSVQVFPTQTKYVFEQSGVQLSLVFSTPAFVNEPESLALPFSYISYNVTSIDGQAHSVQIYYDNTAEQAVADVSENVTWSTYTLPGNAAAMSFGTVAQDIFGQQSDEIDCMCLIVHRDTRDQAECMQGATSTRRCRLMLVRPPQ